MLKNEFEEILGSQVSDEDYKIIEHVYVWHPAISEVNGKRQISDIYRAGGILAIKSMDDWACIMEELDRKYQESRKPVEKLKARIKLAQSGDFSLEKGIKEFTEYQDAGMGEEEILKKLEQKYDYSVILEAKEAIGTDKKESICAKANHISLKTLYDSGHRYLYFGGEIRKYDESYELWTEDADPRFLFHDQEIICILNQSTNEVLIEGTRARVYLTPKEYQIACIR